jgi:hypothetical protein
LVNDIVHGRLSEAAFADLVKAAAPTTGGEASRSSILRNAATSFWRTLAPRLHHQSQPEDVYFERSQGGHAAHRNGL